MQQYRVVFHRSAGRAVDLELHVFITRPDELQAVRAATELLAEVVSKAHPPASWNLGQCSAVPEVTP